MSANLPIASDLLDAYTSSLDYQMCHFAPMILALSKCGVPGYAFAITLGWSVGLLRRPESLPTLLPALVATVVVAQRYQHTRMQGLLAFTHLLVEEAAITVFGHQVRLQWVLPTFYLMPPVTSPTWLTRRDFCIAMVLCTVGPIVVLLITPESASAIHHGWLGPVLYLPICIAAAAVIHHYLLRAMTQHFAAERSSADRANTDHLTSMFARQCFFELGSLAIERAWYHAEPLRASYLDVDHFKLISNTWRHAAGNEALVVLSDALADVLHPADLFGRLGGDEFAVLLSGCGLTGTSAVVERFKTAVAGTQILVRSPTVSVGAASLRPGQDLTRLLADTDLDLMEVKRQDRSHVYIPIDVQPPANLRQ